MASLTGSRPVFSTADLAKSRLFYEKILGFAVVDDADDFFQLERDQATLAVYDSRVHSVPARPGICAVFTDNVDAVAEAVDDRAPDLRSPLELHHRGGYRHFTVRDPDGNTVIFAQPVG